MSVTYRLNRAEMARFMRQVTVQPDGCWYWTGRLTPNGYGRHRIRPGQPERVAHRIIYEHHHNAPVPDGMQLGHTCHDQALERGECDGGADCPHRRCVNPEHVEAQTPKENTLLSNHFQRRKERCPQGHEYTEENTARRHGRRYCRACNRDRKRKQEA